MRGLQKLDSVFMIYMVFRIWTRLIKKEDELVCRVYAGRGDKCIHEFF
jgi:hypothetical protein